MRAASALLPALLMSGCMFGGPEPVPIRGDTPQVIAIWPRVAPPFDDDSDAMLVGLDAAAGTRGYAIVSHAVAGQLLHEAGVSAADMDVARGADVLRADAVITLRVRDFTASGENPLQGARWDLEWRLESTRGGGIVWSFPHHGIWHPTQHTDDPTRPLDAEPDIVPIGGRGVSSFRDRAELVAWLHRMAMSHLPERQR